MAAEVRGLYTPAATLKAEFSELKGVARTGSGRDPRTWDDVTPAIVRYSDPLVTEPGGSMPRTIRAAAVLTIIVALTCPLAAQTSADEKELAAYRLTMPTFRKVVAVTRAMVEEMKQDPKVQEAMKLEAEIDALENKEEPTEAEQERLETLRARKEALKEQVESKSSFNNAQTISEMEAAIRQFPPMANALRREGLAPREYATFFLALFQAAIVHGFRKSGVEIKDLPAGVNPENVKFIAEHEQELEAMKQEFEALGKKPQ
jgi:hypothetical protein